MKVKEVPIGELKPYPNNPRVNDQAVQGVADSLQAFGWQQPIVVDSDNVVIVGHTRLKAAELLGMDKVPVVVADGLTPDEAAAYRLADNKTAEASFWDTMKLDIELKGIELDMSPWFDMQDLSFTTEEEAHGSLKDQFLFVPFSVVDSTKADWAERKRMWIALGIRSEIGRDGDLLGPQGAMKWKEKH